jgi:hypothetical protein
MEERTGKETFQVRNSEYSDKTIIMEDEHSIHVAEI